MVFSASAGGQRVDARRMAQDFVFGDEGRCRAVRDHETGIESTFAHLFYVITQLHILNNYVFFSYQESRQFA